MCVLAASRYFFAGTEHGKVRTYKLPLTGEHSEIKVGQGAVTQLALGQDDCFLFVTTADGMVSVFDIPPDSSQLVPRK